MLIICFIPVGIWGFAFIYTKAACDKLGNACIILWKMEHVEACLILMRKCCRSKSTASRTKLERQHTSLGKEHP